MRIGRVVHFEEAELGVAVWLLPQSPEILDRERAWKHAFLHRLLGESGCLSYRRLLAPTLAAADAAGAVAYLETFGTRSRRFYERLRFVTQAEVAEPTTGAQYAILTRRPQSPRSHPRHADAIGVDLDPDALEGAEKGDE